MGLADWFARRNPSRDLSPGEYIERWYRPPLEPLLAPGEGLGPVNQTGNRAFRSQGIALYLYALTDHRLLVAGGRPLTKPPHFKVKRTWALRPEDIERWKWAGHGTGNQAHGTLILGGSNRGAFDRHIELRTVSDGEIHLSEGSNHDVELIRFLNHVHLAKGLAPLPEDPPDSRHRRVPPLPTIPACRPIRSCWGRTASPPTMSSPSPGTTRR